MNYSKDNCIKLNVITGLTIVSKINTMRIYLLLTIVENHTSNHRLTVQYLIV